jgi:hypothetical protein
MAMGRCRSERCGNRRRCAAASPNRRARMLLARAPATWGRARQPTRQATFRAAEADDGRSMLRSRACE